MKHCRLALIVAKFKGYPQSSRSFKRSLDWVDTAQACTDHLFQYFGRAVVDARPELEASNLVVPKLAIPAPSTSADPARLFRLHSIFALHDGVIAPPYPRFEGRTLAPQLRPPVIVFLRSCNYVLRSGSANSREETARNLSPDACAASATTCLSGPAQRSISAISTPGRSLSNCGGATF